MRALWSCLFILLLGCPALPGPGGPGGELADDDDAAADDDDDGDDDACQPLTCEQLGGVCGDVLDDGCGGEILCDSCEGSLSCLPIDGEYTCSCTVADPGDDVVLDVASVTVHLAVTLAGEPVDADNSTETDGGLFMLKPQPPHAVGWNRVQRATWKDGAPTDRVTFVVVPGVYDIHYQRLGTDPDSPWPVNLGAPLLQQVELREDGLVVDVDVPAVEVAIDLRIDGVDPDGWGIGEGERISVALAGPGRVNLLDTTGPAVASIPERVVLLPGDYAFTYTNHSGSLAGQVADPGSPWPLGAASGFEGGEVQGSPATLSADLVAVAFDFSFDLDGAGPDVAQPTAGDGVQLELQTAINPNQRPQPGTARPPAPKTRVPLLSSPLTLRLAPNSYSVYLQSDRPLGTDSPWPWNRAALATAVPMDQDGSRLFDVDTRQITLSATLGGAAVEPGDGGPQDAGRLGLSLRQEDQAAAIVWLPSTWDADLGEAVASWTVRILEARYDVSYGSVGAELQIWPTAARPIPLLTDVALLDDTVVDVPFADVPISVLVRGASPPPLGEGAQPKLRLTAEAAASNNGQLHKGWMPEASAVVLLDNAPTTVRLVPGSYTAAYDALDDGHAGSWPDSSFRIPGGPWSLGAGDALNLDLGPSPVTLRFSLDGQLADESNTTELDHPRLFMTRLVQPVAGGGPSSVTGTAGWWSFWREDAEVGLPRSVDIDPGEYLVQYYPSTAQEGAFADGTLLGTTWPTSAGFEVGCLEVR